MVIRAVDVFMYIYDRVKLLPAFNILSWGCLGRVPLLDELFNGPPFLGHGFRIQRYQWLGGITALRGMDAEGED